MNKLWTHIIISVFLASCAGAVQREENNQADTSAMVVVDSVKTEMNRLEDSALRAAPDSAAAGH